MEIDPSKLSEKTLFKTGQKVVVRDPVWHNDEQSGFVAKQLDDNHFLIRLDASFKRTNLGKRWLKVCRDYAGQGVREI